MQFKSDASAAAVAEVKANLTKAIAELAKCLGNEDMILAWDNGLAVGFNDKGEYYACGIPFATALPDNRPYIIKNGKGEVAKPMTRSSAAAHYLPTACEIYRDTFC